MSDLTLFFGKFLRHGTKIASLAPSSRWLAQTTIRGIDWTSAKAVVELGAGTGPITRAIADRMAPGCRLLALERDPDFARLLRDRFDGREGVEILQADSRDLGAILADRGLDRVDHVVSGLPVPSFPEDSRRDLFRVVERCLDPNGSFRQITELAWVYQGLYRRFFEDVKFVFEPRNFPPSGAYHCRKIKPVS